MDLSERLFDAFASRTRPSPDQLIRSTVEPDEGAKLRELLAARTSTELSNYEMRTVVEGNLWALTPDAFLYYLPAFLSACLQSYASVSVLASELIDALTKPARIDIIESFDRLADQPPGLGLPEETIELLRKQQLEWFDSGKPRAVFHERFDDLTDAEGAAILAFFDAFRQVRGADFPFEELEVAVDRNWSRYRTP